MLTDPTKYYVLPRRTTNGYRDCDCGAHVADSRRLLSPPLYFHARLVQLMRQDRTNIYSMRVIGEYRFGRMPYSVSSRPDPHIIAPLIEILL